MLIDKSYWEFNPWLDAIALAPAIGAAAIMGKPAIVMMVIGQYGANTLSVSRAVESALEEFEPLFAKQGIEFYSRLFRPADYIETSVTNLTGHLLAGGLFVVAVLYVFLFNIRTALISALALPLSLVSAAVILLKTGATLNIMVLGGLAIALGEVVDDAIIDTENIFRRLRENRLRPIPLPLSTVVHKASLEVRGSVVYASFIVALVFVPLLTMGGITGRLFSPLAHAYILAILTSLGVALTVTPALCYLLLARQVRNEETPPLIRLIHPLYAKLLHLTASRGRLLIVSGLLVCLLIAAALPRLGSDFLPQLREGHFIVHTTGMPGTSLEESLRMGRRLTDAFLTIPGVQSVSQWAGRAERGADTFGSHYSEYEVRLDPMPGTRQQQVLESLREVLGAFPGVLHEANTFLTERVDETISGYTSPVVVNIYGNQLDTLDEKARAVASIMRTIDGATDVQLRSPPGTPLLLISLDLDKLATWGIRPLQVMNAVQTAYEGKVVGKHYQASRVYDVALVLPPTLRRQPQSVGRLPLRTPEGKLISLSEVADIRQTGGRYNILRQGMRRLQTVTCNVDGRDLGRFMEELKNRVFAEVEFTADTYPEFTGAAVEQAQARETLLVQSLLAGAGVMIFVYVALGNLRHTLLTLINLPFALAGGVLAALITDTSLSVGSMVGFVTLFGITVRNAIMLISHYRYLVEEEGAAWNLRTAVQGAQERLPSILMTALVTALAMLPIAFDSDNPGREIMGPMATIIIGGLASSTLLNLLLLPTVLLHFGRFRENRERGAGQ